MVTFVLCSIAIAIALVAGAAPADAVVAKIGGHGYGITPIDVTQQANLTADLRSSTPSGIVGWRARKPLRRGPSGGTQLFNAEGGPVMHSVTTHVIYWDPNKEFSSTTQGVVDGFFGNVAHDSGLPTNVSPSLANTRIPRGTRHTALRRRQSHTDAEKYPGRRMHGA